MGHLVLEIRQHQMLTKTQGLNIIRKKFLSNEICSHNCGKYLLH